MSDTTDRRCKFHLCAATFHATHGNQRFCTTRCRDKYQTWAMNRGRRLTSAAIAGADLEMIAIGQKIKAEYDKGMRENG